MDQFTVVFNYLFDLKSSSLSLKCGVDSWRFTDSLIVTICELLGVLHSEFKKLSKSLFNIVTLVNMEVEPKNLFFVSTISEPRFKLFINLYEGVQSRGYNLQQ